MSINNKSDKPYITRWVIACFVVILIFHFAWRKYFFMNLSNGVFTIIDGILIGGFIVEAIGAIKKADDPNKDWKRLIFILLAVASSAWAAGWSVGLMAKLDQGL